MAEDMETQGRPVDGILVRMVHAHTGDKAITLSADEVGEILLAFLDKERSTKLLEVLDYETIRSLDQRYGTAENP